jgi:polysaccharide biosynthesis/export protein
MIERAARARRLTAMWRIAVATLAVTACTENIDAVYPTAPFDDRAATLGPGDKLELTISNGMSESKATYTLDRAGRMKVKLIGAVAARDRTPEAIEDEITARLADGYLREPIVSVSVVEVNSLKCTVSGEVLHNGTVRVTPGLTITEAIAQSGGFAPLARKNMVKVIRGDTTFKIPVQAIAEGQRENFPIWPGDRVFVPDRPW